MCYRSRPVSASTKIASAGLLAIGGLHVVWSTGSSWPMKDRRLLTDAVVGSKDDVAPLARGLPGRGRVCSGPPRRSSTAGRERCR